MKRAIILVIISAIAAFLLYRFVFKKEKKTDSKETAMAVSTSDTLTGDIGRALQAYYSMKDAFIKSDTVLVNNGAEAFVSRVNDISMQGIEADPAVLELAKQLQQDLARETEQLLAANEIETKRKSFQIISDGLFDLLRSIRYDGSKVYQQYCPMAFDNAGAAWLSKSTEIVNPYFGDAMLHCGEVRDSVNLVTK